MHLAEIRTRDGPASEVKPEPYTEPYSTVRTRDGPASEDPTRPNPNPNPNPKPPYLGGSLHPAEAHLKAPDRHLSPTRIRTHIRTLIRIRIVILNARDLQANVGKEETKVFQEKHRRGIRGTGLKLLYGPVYGPYTDRIRTRV